MKKIPTLFKRVFDDNHRIKEVLNEVTPGCEWVLNGEGIATEKLDGTCTLYKDGHIWKRYDAKHGKPIPENAVPCQPEADPITGHLPCWIPIDENNPSDKWFVKAYQEQLERGYKFVEEQTYELCGIHFQGNPYALSHDFYYGHGFEKINNVPRDYTGIKEYLRTHYIEGLVFHRGNGEMCKIKRTDFGFPWNDKRGELNERS